MRDNVPLRLVQAPAAAAGTEPASPFFAVPDPDRMPDADLAKAVLAAMSDPQQLGGDDDVAALVEVGRG